MLLPPLLLWLLTLTPLPCNPRPFFLAEAASFMLALLRRGRILPHFLWLSHHGDDRRDAAVKRLSQEDLVELQVMEDMPNLVGKPPGVIVVCHSMPTNWPWPEPMPTPGDRWVGWGLGT